MEKKLATTIMGLYRVCSRVKVLGVDPENRQSCRIPREHIPLCSPKIPFPEG